MTSWKDIYPNFTDDLVAEWMGYGFTFEQTRDWINIGLTVHDASFANWLWERNYSPELVLNHGNMEQLKSDYLNGFIGKDDNMEAETDILPLPEHSINQEIINNLNLFKRNQVIQISWDNQGFPYWEAFKWVRIGVGNSDSEIAFARFLKEEGLEVWKITPNDLVGMRKQYLMSEEKWEAQVRQVCEIVSQWKIE